MTIVKRLQPNPPPQYLEHFNVQVRKHGNPLSKFPLVGAANYRLLHPPNASIAHFVSYHPPILVLSSFYPRQEFDRPP
jgi:hypothetical protein